MRLILGRGDERDVVRRRVEKLREVAGEVQGEGRRGRLVPVGHAHVGGREADQQGRVLLALVRLEEEVEELLLHSLEHMRI